MTDLLVERRDAVLTITFNRPDKHNAMTSAMYDRLAEACAAANRDPDLRAMVLTGAGGKAFVAGTDIAGFLDFDDGADGVRYERRITEVLDALEQVRSPPSLRSQVTASAAALPWPRPATCGLSRPGASSAIRSPGHWATASQSAPWPPSPSAWGRLAPRPCSSWPDR